MKNKKKLVALMIRKDGIIRIIVDPSWAEKRDKRGK
jgi:hypothetical protein